MRFLSLEKFIKYLINDNLVFFSLIKLIADVNWENIYVRVETVSSQINRLKIVQVLTWYFYIEKVVMFSKF